MNKLEQILNSNQANIIKGSYKKNEAKAEAYVKGIQKLEQMLQDGMMFGVKADDINTPQYVHQIEIRWLEVENRLDGKGIGDVLSCFDTVFFSREKIMSDTWILSSEIYEEI